LEAEVLVAEDIQSFKLCCLALLLFEFNTCCLAFLF
jgi:hypothetical protein